MSYLKSDIDCKALFAAIAECDEAAFKTLFEIYRERLYAVAFKLTKSAYDAEEITQDVFISLWKSRTKLAAVADPQAYIYTVVYNKISRCLKQQANQERILALSVWGEKKYSNETEETILADDSRKFINHAVARLSPQKRRIYDLSRNQGKNYDEIAEALHLSRHTVKSHLVQAVKFVRGYVKQHILLVGAILVSMFR